MRRLTRLRLAFLGIVLSAGLGACTQHAHVGHADHRFTNAESWAKRFDDPARDAWQKPDEVVRALALAPSAVVADIGAGTGYFAVRLARALPNGRVYGADAEPDMVRYLDARARREGLANLVAVQASPSGSALPTTVDVALLVDVYHHLPSRVRYFADLRSALRPGGRVAIVDFNETTLRGPAHRIPPNVVKDEMTRAGYRLLAEHDFLPDQYFLVFTPRG
jgi:SAM-dependent methyltransferase